VYVCSETCPALHGEVANKKQFVGGYKGDWENAPSGQNQNSKLELLKEEGVLFDSNGFLIDKTLWWEGFNVEKLK
jgi:methylated-DNA-[protein]-cysteine S-methyltransferase